MVRATGCARRAGGCHSGEGLQLKAPAEAGGDLDDIYRRYFERGVRSNEPTAKQDLPVITDREARRNGFRAPYYKEVRDYFRSLKFIIVLVLVTVLGLTGVYGAYNGIQDAISDSSNSPAIHRCRCSRSRARHGRRSSGS